MLFLVLENCICPNPLAFICFTELPSMQRLPFSLPDKYSYFHPLSFKQRRKITDRAFEYSFRYTKYYHYSIINFPEYIGPKFARPLSLPIWSIEFSVYKRVGWAFFWPLFGLNFNEVLRCARTCVGAIEQPLNTCKDTLPFEYWKTLRDYIKSWDASRWIWRQSSSADTN